MDEDGERTVFDDPKAERKETESWGRSKTFPVAEVEEEEVADSISVSVKETGSSRKALRYPLHLFEKE